jgi:hypothetical protein
MEPGCPNSLRSHSHSDDKEHAIPQSFHFLCLMNEFHVNEMTNLCHTFLCQGIVLGIFPGYFPRLIQVSWVQSALHGCRFQPTTMDGSKLLEKNCVQWSWWCTPVIPATREAEVGGSQGVKITSHCLAGACEGLDFDFCRILEPGLRDDYAQVPLASLTLEPSIATVTLHNGVGLSV